jgi:hypothetical protein
LSTDKSDLVIGVLALAMFLRLVETHADAPSVVRPIPERNGRI